MNCLFINKTRDAQWKKYDVLLSYLADLTEKKLKITAVQSVSVIFVRSKKIKEINRDYRQIDCVTDVISFALQDEPCDYAWQEEVQELGDIYINVDAVEQQAKDYGHSVKRELCFLFIHGLLHCHGYDHGNKQEEKKMFKLQSDILDSEVPR
ncbi:MAG: rRNA maturation RNase YbeY [Anaerorhabdus sp.]